MSACVHCLNAFVAPRVAPHAPLRRVLRFGNSSQRPAGPASAGVVKPQCKVKRWGTARQAERSVKTDSDPQMQKTADSRQAW